MGCKILIAEDQDDSRYYLKTLLEREGYQVTEAQNGKVALQLFREASFDLVISDIAMPEMDGLTLLGTIKKSHPEIPLIIISAYSDLQNVVKALHLGACDFLAKPYEKQDILKSIERAARLQNMVEVYKICTAGLTKESRHFVFGNDLDQINSIAQFLCRDLAMLNMKSEIHPLQTSLVEGITNAILHGNLEISSKIKTHEDILSFDIFKKMARSKMLEAPYCDRKIFIEYSLDEEKMSYLIRDEGSGFNHKKLPDPLDPEGFLNPSGRGLLLIRTFCDEVSWNETGNEITFVKYRNS